jgi:hypothetical protein
VTLDFAPAQSFFVVFRKGITTMPLAATHSVGSTVLAELPGAWSVHFDPAWGGPGTIEFAALEDWSKHANAGIRFYSGTATYRKKFRLPKLDRRTIWLDLGTVRDIATVTVNDKKLGVVWTAPWRIDITSAVTAGENAIKISVTNEWANRLIGDEQQPPDIVWLPGDPVLKGGAFLKEFPEWFLNKEPRPSKARYTFTTWNYFTNKDTPLLASGLLGPVTVLAE